MKPRIARWRGPLLALALSAATITAQLWRVQDPHIVYDRFRLPTFDAHIYLAMAEHPAFFTVAPWGYRVLTPWLVAALPHVNPVRGLRYVTLAGLTLTGLMLFLFLRRLGHGEWPSLLAVGVFGLSDPVLEVVRYPFMAEPLALLILTTSLWALEAGVGLGVLALLAALGALSKDVLLAALPLLWVAARARGGSFRQAAVRTGVAVLPALVVTLSLRLWWTPYLSGSHQSFDAAYVWAALKVIVNSLPLWFWPALVGGLMPLAILGALREKARPFLRRYGYLALLYLALPFAAGVYVGEPGEPTEFFSGDVPRLMLYLLPLLLPLGLTALDRVWPQMGPAPAMVDLKRPTRIVAGMAAVFVASLPFLLTDPYRRVELGRPHDGTLFLAISRETLRTAQRLERGKEVSFTPESYRWVRGKSDPPLLGQMRWFLREGWGVQAHYGVRDIVMRSAQASLLLPCLRPRDLDLVLTLDSREAEQVEIFVNGQRLGAQRLGAEGTPWVLRVPAAWLFRGDNLVTLRRASDSHFGPRLLAFALRPV
jgi:hypothetical protein